MRHRDFRHRALAGEDDLEALARLGRDLGDAEFHVVPRGDGDGAGIGIGRAPRKRRGQHECDDESEYGCESHDDEDLR